MAEHNLSKDDAFQIEIRNTCAGKAPLTFVKVVRPRKAAEQLQSAKQAKRRVAPLNLLMEKFITREGDVESGAKIFKLVPKKTAKTLNKITSDRAGVKIRPFDAITLAALEEQAGLTYAQSSTLRYFMKTQGAGAQRKAGSTIEYRVGNLNVFSKTEDSEIEKEISYVVVENFNAAFAWWVAEERYTRRL